MRFLVSLIAAVAGTVVPASAGLEAYDDAIASDDAGSVLSIAKLTGEVILTGANRAAFNFGNTAGDVTMEFILEGDPVGGGLDGYLAVGSNATSSLRYEQWRDSGQLGFTQLGVEDYLFSPAVPSPKKSVHIAYVWEDTAKTMTLYMNGAIAGSRMGVKAGFSMPTGRGYLGANPGNVENMVGTIHRVTVYSRVLPGDLIQRHADAFNDVVRPPVVVSFHSSSAALFTPSSATLIWDVIGASTLYINGTDVTSLPSLTVSPLTTTTYTLTAINAGGRVTAQITVLVNSTPVIRQFSASKTHVRAGENVRLSWEALYGQDFTIRPGPGAVTDQTTNGAGRIEVQPPSSTVYELTVGNRFGTSTAKVTVLTVQPAAHLVISEFMAADKTILADEDGDHSGWIEIHNPTQSPVNLASHFLTDDARDPTQWAFPILELAADGYLVAFGSGKSRADPDGLLHTNFRLSNSGEYLALVGPGPILLHAFHPEFPPQRADVSYGILGGDPLLEQYFGEPTPSMANRETPPPPDPVRFSHPNGTFAETFAVTLETGTPNAVIRYTLDGSVPGVSQGIIYGSPLSVTGTIRLRAVAIAEGRASPVTGVSYIRLSPDLKGYTSSLPILVIENFGAGVIPQKGWSSTGSGVRQVPRQSAVWATFESETGAHTINATPQMMSDIGIRGRGAFSTTWRQKPYSVEAMTALGEEAEVSPLGMPAHADWVLYFPDPDDNKDPTLLFNTFAYELSANTGRYSVRFRWVEAFVNEDGGDLSLADRRGIYAVMEKVSRGKNRLDFEKLSDDGTNGGWLLNINRMDAAPEAGWPAPNGATRPQYFHTAGPNRIQETPPNTPSLGDDIPRQSNGFLNFDNPGGYTMNSLQRAAIENWFRIFEDVLYNNERWRDPVNGYRRYLDDLDFIDYIILNVLTRNGDGLLISLFPWKGDDGKLRMGPAWDYNWSAYYISGSDPTGALRHGFTKLWYARLFSDRDFHQRYIDRWWKLRLDSMSNDALEAIIDRQAAVIGPEKALINGLPSAREWSSRLTRMKTWLKSRADWIDTNYVRPPVFNRNGGPIPNRFQLVVQGANGTLYVTVDGNDPRAPGGFVGASAQVYRGPVTILGPTRVQARVKNGNKWSGLTSAFFYPPQNLDAVVLTEIMYNPPPFDGWNGGDLEFIELKNTGTITHDLSGLSFTAGIQFTFPPGTRLDPGHYFVLGRNDTALHARYPGLTVHGIYTGRLDNGGETIRLATSDGTTVFSVTYNDRVPWPIAADGHGLSLVSHQPISQPNSDRGQDWRTSNAVGGSPGTADPESRIPIVVINEIVPRTDAPQLDAVELFNPAEKEVNIGGWWLSDDGSVPQKFRIPDGTKVPAQSYAVFTGVDFDPSPGTLFNFSLDSAGDSVYLASADAEGQLTGYSHGVAFGGAADGVSFGRYLNSIGEEHFPAQIASTILAANAGPRIGPVVIQEIHYHPKLGQGEFLELRNVSRSDVPLFDRVHQTNTWRVNGLGFKFPENVVLRPNGLLLIVPNEPAAFRTRYAVPSDVLVMGPFPGNLQDSGERLELQYPDTRDTSSITYITVDEVRYNDKTPWPPSVEGGGPSLQRRTASAYGNDPINWEARVPTPGWNFQDARRQTIAVQPQSQSITANGDALFGVAAAGTGVLRFQWRFEGIAIDGATQAIFSLDNVQAANEGQYTAVITDDVGTIESEPARLTVLMPPTFVQGLLNQRVPPGGTAVFSITTTGTLPISYRWRRGAFIVTNLTLNAHSSFLTLTDVQAIDVAGYTVEASNVALVSPGILSASGDLTLAADTDEDGVPDDWEIAAGLNPNDPVDAATDKDGDGMSNWEEYTAGTDPDDPNRYLKVDQISPEIPVSIVFTAAPNTTYTIEYTPTFNGGSWTRLSDVAAQPLSHTETVLDPDPELGRYYRLATPRLP